MNVKHKGVGIISNVRRGAKHSGYELYINQWVPIQGVQSFNEPNLNPEYITTLVPFTV